MNEVSDVTRKLRTISELQGIERQALQLGDPQSLIVARWMREAIAMARASIMNGGDATPEVRN